MVVIMLISRILKCFCSHQELIEPAKPAREHVTAHYDYVDGEIQTWPSYSKCSNIRVWA